MANSKGGRQGRRFRRNSALKRLEETYSSFVNAGKDKPSWTSTRNGRIINHSGRSFKDECDRLKSEISHLREILKK